MCVSGNVGVLLYASFVLYLYDASLYLCAQYRGFVIYLFIYLFGGGDWYGAVRVIIIIIIVTIHSAATYTLVSAADASTSTTPFSVIVSANFGKFYSLKVSCTPLESKLYCY